MTTSNFLEVTIFSLLFLGCTYGGLEASNTDSCEDDITLGPKLKRLRSSNNKPVAQTIPKVNVTCLIYSTHELHCSWSFQSLKKEAQISTTISVCDDEDETVQTMESEERAGSRSCLLEKSAAGVILHFNISLHDHWELYYLRYDTEELEVLPPPPNVQALFNDNNLRITWDPPPCCTDCPDHCLEYQVHLRDQEKVKCVENKLSYTELNADLTQSYEVKIRARINNYCSGLHQWSDWSQPVTLMAPQSMYHLNAGVILAISLGIPMILLALLLLLCQRVSKCLFPPVPSPPQKYLHILQNTDVFVSPDLAANPDEEITLVFFPENEKPLKI